jgi:hypothetical protein
MTRRRIPRSRAVPCLSIVALLCVSSLRAAAPEDAADPLAQELARWVSYAGTNSSRDELWTQVRGATAPALVQAGDALRANRRLYALQRLAAARTSLAAWMYVGGRPAEERKDASRFEAEWTRMGGELGRDLGTPVPSTLDRVTPAAVRAIGETALPQVRAYYESSLAYGRATSPESGLYYLGNAVAARELLGLCRQVARPGGKPAPPLRALDAELDALETAVLSAYRPPASLDRHAEFIGLGSALNEARELSALGLKHGALLRYLQAVQRLASLRSGTSTLGARTAAERLDAWKARFTRSGADHSIGELFIEAAEAELASVAAGDPLPVASAVVTEVLPRYIEALEPAVPRKPLPPAEVTVTLVRWPFT